MRYLILSIGFVSFLLSGSFVCAAPEVSSRPEVRENVRQLLENNSCPGCDLAGAILHRGEFSGADLEGANLAGSQMNLANLSGANLKDANLQGASFGGADLAGADLTGANLTGAVIEGAYLSGAKMDGQVVANVSLNNVKVPAGNLVGELNGALPLIEALALDAKIALAAEALGIMGQPNSKSLEYTKTREQFDVAIGSFQALQHRMVDTFMAYEQAKSMLYRALCEVEEGNDDLATTIHALSVMTDKAGKHILGFFLFMLITPYYLGHTA